MTTDDEDVTVSELLPTGDITKEQREFNDLSMDSKLQRLNTLIQRSQLYSKIISENILESTVKKTAGSDESPKASKNVSKSVKASGKKGKNATKNPKQDITQMLSKGSSDQAKAKKQKIEKSQTEHTQKQPSLLTGGLMKDYQLDGLQWLSTLYENGLNGILADEMGLGKTLQCISFFCFLIENGIKGPFLVVAPLSTIGNWALEIERFAPSLSVLKYSGSKPERHNIKLSNKYNIILTSYEMSIRDFSRLSSIEWKYLIVDEGHRLKNMNSVLISFLKKLNISNRLLITGTPLQNNLNELWSLLNFILPDIFHDLELFQQLFNFDELTNFEDEVGDEDFETKQAIKLKIQENLIHNLHTILKPFLLRRLKREVIRDLPPKKEYLIYVPLTNLQRKIYVEILDSKTYSSLVKIYVKEFINYNFREHFEFPQDKKFIESFLDKKFDSKLLHERKRPENFREEASDDEFEAVASGSEEQEEFDITKLEFDGLSKSKKKSKILEFCFNQGNQEIKHLSLKNTVMQLRNICNSPYVFYEPFFKDETHDTTSKFVRAFLRNSVKVQILDQLLKELLPQHKVLIFSQFTKVLDLLHDWLNFNKIGVCRLDGSTGQSEREEQMYQFNNDKSKQVFLLSTRAGGLGINLAAADTVIIFDSDWNPQVDLQAVDRVHRIGQKNPVKVFRLIVRNSFEEVLISKSSSKRFLEKLVIQMGEFKFKQLQGIINKKDNNLKELLEFSKQFKNFHQSLEDDDNWEYSYWSLDDPGSEDKYSLSKEEIRELMDRSDKCYISEDENFSNIAVFETSSNDV